MSSYQRKVNSIVDKIVEGNIEFNNKSINKQDRDKADMSSSILKAISLLNDVGQKLVLNELDVRATRESIDFFDSAGKIDISEFTKFTTVIVKSTIEDAKRKGIDLTTKSENKEKDTSVTKAILSVVVIDKMLNNYENLSYEDKRDLISNFKNMTGEQKIKMFDSGINFIEDLRNNAKTTEEKEKFDSIININETLKKLTEAFIINGNLQKSEELIKNNPELINSYNGKFTDKKIDINTINNENISNISKSIIEGLSQDWLDYKNKYEEVSILNKKQSKTKKEEEKLKRLQNEIDYLENNNKVVSSLINNKHKHYNQENHDRELNNSNQNLLETTLDKRIAKEIANIPIALAKINFSPEQIKEALSTYKELLVDLNEEDRSKENNDIYDILCDKADSMELSKSTEDILGIVLELKYIPDNNDSLSEILSDPETRKSFLQEFDKVIEQETNLEQNTEQDINLDGELEEVLNQYFEENAVEIDISKFEEQKTTESAEPQIPEEYPQDPPKQPSDTYKPVEHNSFSVDINQDPEFNLFTADTINEVQESNVGTITNTNNLNEGTEIKNNSENKALEVQDNSFIGKVRRVIATMRDSKNNDKSKGFFSRLKNSIENVFFDKREEEDNNNNNNNNNGTSPTEQSTTQPETYDPFYRVEIDHNKAREQTEANARNKSNENKRVEEEVRN